MLFITSVLAAVWSIATLFRRKSTRRSALWVSFIDLCIAGALIAGVYELRNIAKADCSHFSSSGAFSVTLNGSGFSGTSGLHLHVNKSCAMLKASFAFGIMNIIFFFMTSFLLLFMRRGEEKEVVVKETYRRRSHESRYIPPSSIPFFPFSHLTTPSFRRGHSRSGSGHHRSSRDGRRQPYV